MRTQTTAPLAAARVMLLLAVTMTAPVALATTQPTILVLGDSISAAYGIQREQGWVAHLQRRLADLNPPWQVVNASVSGETTSGGLARLPATLQAHDPEVLVIELGGNDALRGYPIERIKDNILRLVTMGQEASVRVLLVGMQIPPNYGPRYTSAFSNLFREISDQTQVPLVPFILEPVALTPELMQGDGIHPTAEAQPLMLETIWPYLEPLLAR